MCIWSLHSDAKLTQTYDGKEIDCVNLCNSFFECGYNCSFVSSKNEIGNYRRYILNPKIHSRCIQRVDIFLTWQYWIQILYSSNYDKTTFAKLIFCEPILLQFNANRICLG